MTISRRTAWLGGTAVACLLIVALSWFFLISPQRTSASDLASQRENVDSTATTLSAKIAALKQQSLQLSAKREELAQIHTQLPESIDMSALIASVVKLATDTGVSVTSLAPGTLTAAETSATSATGEASTSTAGVQQQTVSIAVQGDYFETSLFLKRLQTQLPQAFLVDTLTVAGTGTATTLTVAGRVFTLPAST